MAEDNSNFKKKKRVSTPDSRSSSPTTPPNVFNSTFVQRTVDIIKINHGQDNIENSSDKN